MRRVLTIALTIGLVAAMAAPAFAISKGTFRLGARNLIDQMSLGLDGNDLDVDIVTLDGGYFILDNVELGLSYGEFNIEDEGPSQQKIFGRYFIPVAENSAFVGGGYADLDFMDADGDYLFITAGFALQVKEFFSIDFAILLGEGDIEGEDIDVTDLSVTYSLYF